MNVGAADSSLERLDGFWENVWVKSEGSRVCLWGLFQSGGSEGVIKLLDDWWSESRRKCAI